MPAFPRGLDHFEAAAARLIELNRLGVSLCSRGAVNCDFWSRRLGTSSLQEKKYGLAMKDEIDLIKLASVQGSYETQ